MTSAVARAVASGYAGGMRRIPELDSLRALAALVVLLFHLNPPRFFFGWTGVDLFFVLSGYLITSIILDHQGKRGFLRNFYARRGLRIWPIYYLALFAVVATAPFVPVDRRPPLKGLGYYVAYLQNISLYQLRTPPEFHIAFDHTWTLALEEQFYLIWPALIALASLALWDRWGLRLAREIGLRMPGAWQARWHRRPAWVRSIGGREARLIGLCVTVVLVAILARDGGTFRLGRYPERILISRCDGFALGGLLAVLLSDRDRLARHRGRFRLAFGLTALGAFGYIGWKIATAGMGYLGLPTPADPGPTIFVVSLAYFGLVGTVTCFAGHPALAPLRWHPLCYLGLISYGIYLYHYIIYWVYDGFRFTWEDSIADGAAKIGLTLLVAVLSWHLVERPILGLKERFRYETTEPVETAREPAAV